MTDILAKYTFLPWMRRGLSTKIKEKDNFNDFSSPPSGGWTLERPEMIVKAKVTAKNGGTTDNEEVEQQVKVVGPGDIIGIDHRIVVKVEPRNWITNFEPNYFPYIEFYEEDFPWRYSPASPDANKLRPWLTLIVLKESEFTKDKVLFDKLPSILVNASEDDAPGTTGAAGSAFPDPGQLWAWTHVHLNGDVDPTANNSMNPGSAADLESALNRFKQLLNANPDQASARMMCPRKLDANTNYFGFLIPTFETGRLAGLGADATIIATHKAQEASFGADHLTDADHQIYADHFPVYYEWQFTTGDVGDFESLVRKLEPREVDRKVGKREMNIQQPGYGVKHGDGEIHNDGMLYLEGAMLPPRTGPEPDREAFPWSTDAPDMAYMVSLTQLVNLGEDIRKATFDPAQFYNNNPFGYEEGEESLEDDPIISPDLYGRWHALRDTLDARPIAITNDPSWLYEANVDPRSRAVAGLGVQHVKNNQEKLMDRAWGQLGDVIEANRKLRWGQIAKKSSEANYKKHIKFQKAEQFNAITNKVFRRVKYDSSTAYMKIKESAVSNATQSYAYRKIERPQSPIMKRLDPKNEVFTNNSLRVSMGTGSLKSVDDKTYSDDNLAHFPLDAADANVTTISQYNASAPVFATMLPNAVEFAPDIDSELRFKTAVNSYQSYFEKVNWQDKADAPTITLADIVGFVVNKINPKFILPKRVYDRLRLPGYIAPPADKIVPVMAYPFFDQPMYQAVKELGVDYLIPNLDLIPNNTITLLESNQKFIEAFMLGLNHEMGRELLWREYPTDQRGSYFRQFWDSADAVPKLDQTEEDVARDNLDIEEIHKWPTNENLGTHSPRPGAETGLLILVVRGDLLKKYPDTIIYAQEAKFPSDTTDFSEIPRELATEKRYPLFSAVIEPDIHFFGFDLDSETARGSREEEKPGWFFILQERPGEIRFGLDVSEASTGPNSWSDLSRGNAAFKGQHLDAKLNEVVTSSPANSEISNKQVLWGENSTNFAQILYQDPVLLAVHGDEMIP
ncbi:MAG: hypothetical protein AAGA77_02855 [Bacteroidota bacterium]